DGHGEREPGVEIRPDAMHDPLEMADHSQHREYRFHQHAVLPLAPLTQLEIAGIALRGMEAGVAQDNHALLKLSNQPLEGVICYIGCRTLPTSNPVRRLRRGDFQGNPGESAKSWQLGSPFADQVREDQPLACAAYSIWKP